MVKEVIKAKFFVFNPKSYLFGESLKELVHCADGLVDDDISIFVTAPYADLKMVSDESQHLIVTAQHLDAITPGRGMGKVLPHSLVNSGVKAVFLNHAEHPMTLGELVKAITIAQELELITIVCADSIAEARAIATLAPDIILCEPTDLIGTGKTSDSTYVAKTNQAIREINPDIRVMQAAGISSPEDVFNIIRAGADGTGCTSGIVKAKNPKEMLTKMVLAVKEARIEKEV
ncbi:triose-phosphate isomerase [Streptococcus iniae]|uniref:triose-phosphate isomerase n=1 Tax=Streptococcus iniae TaxID=1346 RepID=UPI0008D9DE72|nr:triose-phosphate isomerase [Streptococcus iniae]OHX27065.1 triose-phosphate isomerase [Streptococcus iniae]RLV28551.1 triose-phosphate isomerase [Streptococcus iniae]